MFGHTSIASNSTKKSNFDPPSIPRDDIKKKVEEPLKYFQILPQTSRLSF